MQTEQKTLRLSVREGYQVLLRAEAELLLPIGKERMRAFYLALGETCMRWAEEIEGERLRRAYAELGTLRERSGFRPGLYRLRMRIPWEEEGLMAMLCESELYGESLSRRAGLHRTVQIWDVEEELILPPRQALSRLAPWMHRRMLPFHPDGFYPQENGLLLFRNPSHGGDFLEKRIARPEGGGGRADGRESPPKCE